MQRHRHVKHDTRFQDGALMHMARMDSMWVRMTAERIKQREGKVGQVDRTEKSGILQFASFSEFCHFLLRDLVCILLEFT